jgi:hypothetical protein
MIPSAKKSAVLVQAVAGGDGCLHFSYSCVFISRKVGEKLL